MLDFTAIDFETANPKRGSVCQVGIARVRDGQIIASAGSYVTPPPGLNHFAPANIRIHGIRPHHVAGAPDWPIIADWLHKVIGTDVLVAHNASFERSVITQASAATGIEAPVFTYACSMKLARTMQLPVENHKLNTLVAHYGLPMGRHHDAEADAIMSAQIMLAVARDAGITDPRRLITR